MKRYGLALSLGILFIADGAHGYTFIYDIPAGGRSNPVGRTSGNVTFTLTFRRPSGVVGDPFLAVRNAFATWDAVSTANIAFTDGGQVFDDSVAQDGVNRVTFQSTTTINFPAGTFALTTIFRSGGSLVDADIAFNPTPPQPFSLDGRAATADIESIVLHEIGHFMGLDHCAILSSAMYPFMNIGNTFKRSLTTDDQIGMSIRYPAANFTATTGRVDPGVIADQNLSPIPGAHLVAVRNSDGVVIASAMADDENDGLHSLILLEGLPPDTYIFYVEPLDSPVTIANFDTNFPGRPFNQVPGLTTRFLDTNNIAPLTITPANAQRFAVVAGNNFLFVHHHVDQRQSMNLTQINSSVLPVYADRGTTTTLTLSGNSLDAAGTLLITGVGVTLSNTVINAGTITTTATVDATATLGPRSLMFTGRAGDGQHNTPLSGAFVVQGAVVAVTTTTTATSGGGGGGEAAATTTDGGDGGGKNQSNCCVATVLLGGRTSPGMTALYAFRNRLFRPSEAGLSVEKLYYAHCPPVARHVSRSFALKAVGRKLLYKTAVQPLQTGQAAFLPPEEFETRQADETNRVASATPPATEYLP